MILEHDTIFKLFATEILEKTSKFSDYFNSNITKGKLDYDIYLIKSSIKEENETCNWNEMNCKKKL